MNDSEEHRDTSVAPAKPSQLPVAPRLLVCVGSGPTSADLVRAARWMAASLNAPWLAVHVETAGDTRLAPADQQQLAETLQLAEQLGAEAVTITATDVAEELVRYARSRNVTNIVIGKPNWPRWKDWLRGALVYEIIRRCDDIDVYVIRGETDKRPRRVSPVPAVVPWRGFLAALAVVAACTGIGWFAFPHLAAVNLIMVYLIGVVIVSLWHGRGPSMLASVLSVAAFDFFFVPPYLTFRVADTQYLFMFAVMLVTGLVISTLTARVQFQAESARRREQRTATLYAMARDLVHAASLPALGEVVGKHLRGWQDCDVFLLLRSSASSVPVARPSRSHSFNAKPQAPARPLSAVAFSSALNENARRKALDRAITDVEDRPEGDVPLETLLATGEPLEEHERSVAVWVLEHGEVAGFGTSTLPSSRTLFVPLTTSQGRVGVLGVRPRAPKRLFTPDELRLLETFAGQIALAIERVRSSEDSQRHRVQLETERLRNSLLSAVSHDLRTPLAAIAGASSTLAESGPSLSEDTREELAASIYAETERLNRLVANLLDMTRLEAGALQLQREWQSLDDLIGGVVNRLSRLLRSREIVTHLPDDLPLVFVDELLMHQVLTNLLENAHRYAPAGLPIEISASVADGQLAIEIADRGTGFAPGEERLIFEKFYRSTHVGPRTGAGLGLAICRGILELHGGWILAENRIGGGAVFHISLPQPAEQPSVPKE
ncbi:MAG: sensor histidine kinase KdpD [Planctomycetes bacterium]|nr:sensor histidine kinase KdpD [Planctomycetota bacterium]